MKCPHCTEGKFFEGSFVKGNVKDKCDSCGRSYTKETGFYQGSYYVAYALGVASFVTMWVATSVLMPDDVNVLYQLLTILGGMIVMMPFLYPLSKIIWANLFFTYKGKSDANKNLAEAK